MLNFFDRDVLFEVHLKFWNTASICIFHSYYKVDRLLTGPTAQQKGTAARWYSNKTSLYWKRIFAYFIEEVPNMR